MVGAMSGIVDGPMSGIVDGPMSGIVYGPTHNEKYDFKLLSDSIMQIRKKVDRKNVDF